MVESSFAILLSKAIIIIALDLHCYTCLQGVACIHTSHFPMVGAGNIYLLCVFDWFTGLSLSVVIDRNDNFGFGFTTHS